MGPLYAKVGVGEMTVEGEVVVEYENSGGVVGYQGNGMVAYENSDVGDGMVAYENGSVVAYGNGGVAAYKNSGVVVYKNSGVAV